MATSDRKGRDGASPSATHLREKCVDEAACPLATLAVAGSSATERAPKFALMGLAPARELASASAPALCA